MHTLVWKGVEDDDNASSHYSSVNGDSDSDDSDDSDDDVSCVLLLKWCFVWLLNMYFCVSVNDICEFSLIVVMCWRDQQ